MYRYMSEEIAKERHFVQQVITIFNIFDNQWQNSGARQYMHLGTLAKLNDLDD